MKKVVRIFSVLLISVLIFASCGKGGDDAVTGTSEIPPDINPGAVNKFIYEDGAEPGEITLTGYSGIESSFSIPSEIDGKNVTAIAENCFRGFSHLKRVVIPDTVRVMDEAFVSCAELEYAYVGTGVTSMSGAFRGCPSLVAVYGGDNAENIDEAFMNCGSLKKGIIPAAAVSAVDAFSGCISLSEVEIRSGITALDGTFSGCSKLTSVTLPESVTSLSGTFSGCSALGSVSGLSGVSVISGAFNNCTALTSLSLGENVTELTGAFTGCSALTEVNGMPLAVDKYTPSYTGCASILKITVPEIRDAELLAGYSPTEDFAGCESCTELNVLAAFTVREEFCGMVSDMRSLETVTFPESVSTEVLRVDHAVTDTVFEGTNADLAALLKQWKKAKTARITEAYGSIDGVSYTHIFGSDVDAIEVEDIIAGADVNTFEPYEVSSYWCGYPDGGARKTETVGIERKHSFYLRTTGKNGGELPESVVFNGKPCRLGE